jgi:predicted nucleic acid-binding protein
VNVVDSSAWLEYFASGPNSDFFAGAVEATADLVVPTVVIYEVFKQVLRQRGEDEALQSIAALQQGRVVDLTPSLAIEAARTSAALGLPMADSIILATGRSLGATIWTQDADFAGVEGVTYVARAAGG